MFSALPQCADRDTKWIFSVDTFNSIKSTHWQNSNKPATRPEVHISRLKVNEVFREINQRFHGNLLSLNYDETCFLQYVPKKNEQVDTQISFGNRQITNIHSTKFVGWTVDTSLSWKYHIEELKPKLNKACTYRNTIRSVKPFMSLEVLRMTYFSYVHSVLSYGIIFWGNSSYI